MHFKESVLYINYSALTFYNLTLRILKGYNLSLFNNRTMLLAKNRVGQIKGKRIIKRDL
jgi:hypothetical protein